MIVRTLAILACVVAGLCGSVRGEMDPSAGTDASVGTQTSITPDRLMCEFRTDPEGIAATRPRLSWRLTATDEHERGAAMGAYRVIAAASEQALAAGSPLLWDTGRVERAAGEGAELLPTRVEYAGEALRSRDRVWWKVQVWDQDGREAGDGGWSAPARFSIGLLETGDWRAQWIGLDDRPEPPLTGSVRAEFRRQPWIRSPGGPERHVRVARFRKVFEADAGAVRSAWLAGAADMMSQVWIDGQEVEGLARWEMLRPIHVTGALKAGAGGERAESRHVVAIRVENHDGFNPAVTGMLVMEMADGSERRIAMDESWKYADGDAGSEGDGWRAPGFDDSAWKKVEVSGSQPWGGARNTEHFMPRTPYLRREFAVDGARGVRRATLYATALGVYECSINGQRVGNEEFAPGWTEYSKRVEHQTYDVTALVRPKTNCIGAIVGDGWYAGLMGYTGQRRYYGGAARFMAQLEIDYADGSRETIATGPEWRGSFGPVLYTDNYMGCAYDARLEKAIAGWNTAGFDVGAWRAVDVGDDRAREARSADVTARLRAMVKDDRLSVGVGPAALGDPAYGVVKTLSVDYSVAGRQASVSLREGETLRLPSDGESGALEIRRAVFAEPAPPPPAPFVIEPQMGEPVRRFEELPAQKVTEPRPGRYVFDLGQNMVGWVRLRIRGEAGQRLVVRHAEMLNPDGTLYTSNLRGATATDFFMLKGGGEETLEPTFTFHGFRYVEITGLRARPEPAMVTGIVAHTAMRPTGTFECSSPLVNRLVHNIVWGQKGNYFSVPTDCPQRDERLGWTGDAQFFVNTAAYDFDIAAFMGRWLKALNQDAQFADGTFAHVAPKVNERGGSTAWGDAAIVCTHAIYRSYGDTRVIADNYDAMARYMKWLDSRTHDGIAHVGGFGDWLNLNDPTAPDLIDTAYRAELCRLMSEMAGVIGQRDDAERFRAAHHDTVRAFRARFIGPDGSLKESGQTGYALAFTMGLIPEELRARAAAHFAESIGRTNGHLATGFIGTPRLLPALANAGLSNLAAKLLMNEDYPSWLYQVRLGATTMWERWDGWTPERGFSDVGMNSFNHYAFGSVGDYIYRYVAGISALEPGYTRILVAPTLTAGLEWAKATYDSDAGAISSAWRVISGRAGEPARIIFEITIPPNTDAEIRLPVAAGEGHEASITEGGRPLADAPGLRVVSVAPSGDGAPGQITIKARSGTYRFEAVQHR